MKTRFYVLGYTEEIMFDPLFEPKKENRICKGQRNLSCIWENLIFSKQQYCAYLLLPLFAASRFTWI